LSWGRPPLRCSLSAAASPCRRQMPLDNLHRFNSNCHYVAWCFSPYNYIKDSGFRTAQHKLISKKGSTFKVILTCKSIVKERGVRRMKASSRKAIIRFFLVFIWKRRSAIALSEPGSRNLRIDMLFTMLECLHSPSFASKRHLWFFTHHSLLKQLCQAVEIWTLFYMTLNWCLEKRLRYMFAREQQQNVAYFVNLHLKHVGGRLAYQLADWRKVKNIFQGFFSGTQTLLWLYASLHKSTHINKTMCCSRSLVNCPGDSQATLNQQYKLRLLTLCNY